MARPSTWDARAVLFVETMFEYDRPEDYLILISTGPAVITYQTRRPTAQRRARLRRLCRDFLVPGSGVRLSNAPMRARTGRGTSDPPRATHICFLVGLTVTLARQARAMIARR